MKTKKLIKALLGISFLTLGMVTANDVKENKVVDAAEQTITLKYDDTFSPAFPESASTTVTSYTDSTANFNFKAAGIYKKSSYSYLMFGQNKGYMYNVEDLGTITQIDVTYSGGVSTSAKIGVYFGDSEMSTYTTSSNATIKGQNQTDTFTNSQTGLGYFQLSTSNKNTQITKLVITYQEGGSTTDPSLSISSDTDYMDVNGEVTFAHTIENADETTVTYTSSDPAVASFEGNVLKAKSVGKVDVTASMVVNGTTYTSNKIGVKVWPEADSPLTITEAEGLSSLLNSGEETPYSYIVKGKITEIYNEQYGNAYIEDETGSGYTIFGMYDEDGNGYDAMTNKPVVNGTYSFEGKIKNYNGTIETVNAIVTKVAVATGAYFTTQAQLGFSYEYSIIEKEGSGSYNVVPSELGLENAALLENIKSPDGVVTISGSKGTHKTSAPAYYSSDTTLRVYAGNTVTFSADSMTSIEIICKSSEYALSEPTVEGGSVSVNGTTVTIDEITGSEVILTPDKTARITGITVVYSGVSSSYEFTNFDNYQLRFFAEVQEVQVETLIKEGESIEDLTFGALITPKSYMEKSGYASFEVAYAENSNIDFEEVFAAKNVTANYVDGQFGIILNNIPTTDVEICVVLYAQATDGTMYFVEQKTVSVESVVTAYYNQINSLGLEEEQIEAVKALYAQVTAQA